MAYDPEDLGAQCYQCVLKTKRVGGPVPPEIHGKETVAVINDVPSQKDCDENRPLTDGGGMEFTRTLQNCGEHRKNVAIFNAIPCRPPENDFDKLMLQWQRQNKKLIAAGQDPLPSPIECCRPRLMQEIEPYQNLVTLGKVAYKAVTGSSAAILEMRGGPIEGRLDEGHFTFKPAETPGQTVTGHWPIKLMPTIHPGMVIRARRWTKAFNTDIARAFRFFKDRLNWAKPWMRFTPTPDEIRKFLWSTDQFAYDTETTVEDATVARLKCITVSTGDGGICIPFYSIESNSSVYRDDELEEIKGILREWFTDPNILKTGWNNTGFDVHIIENHLGVTPAPTIDGMLLHRLVESELPHRLGYVGSVYLDVTAWKAAHTAKEARSDMELWTYGITDTIVTHRVIEILASAVEAKEQVHLVEKDHKIQQMCAGMKHVGMWVDREQRLKEAVRVQAEIIKFRQVALRASGKPDLNLNSTYKLRDLLFSEWDLAPSEYTKTGDPSTSDDAMRLIRSQNLSNPQVTSFIDALRMFRRASKEYGTYIARMIPYGQSVDDVNLEWFDEDEEDPEVARGLIMRDGRIHPNYNGAGTTSGRLSSSNPNCFTGDTEILTEDGWIRFDQLPRGLRCAQYHPDGTVDFTLPTAYIEEEFNGELIHNHNQHINLLTTPDHRCLLRNRKTDDLKVFLAKDYPEDWHQIHAGQYAGGPGIDISDAALRFIVATQADGSWSKGTVNRRLDFGVKKSRKVQRMTELLKELGDQVVVRTLTPKHETGSRWGLEGPVVDLAYEYLGQEKLFGSWLLKLNRQQIDLVLEEIWYWDGCFTRKNHYSSNEKVNVDWMQALMALTGSRAHSRVYQGTKSINHQVDITRRDYSYTTNRTQDRIAYAGKVYCISIPSSYIIVRRGGEVMVTGQSQNFPKHLRGMVKAAPGHILVGADADQLELRIISSIAQIPIYLEAFAKGDDPHSHTAAMMFGEHFTKLEKKSTQWKNLRTLAKGIKYASFYGSGDETVHGIVTSAENEKGELLFPDLTLKQLRTIRRKWLGAIPQLPAWWDACLDYYRRHGCMRDPVWGRRRDFLDGEKFNEIVNFGPQCVPGWSRVLTKEGYLPIGSLVGTHFTAWTGSRWAPATAIAKGLAQLVRVEFSNGQEFICDKSHSGRVNRDGPPAWVRLSESVGQHVWIDTRQPSELIDGRPDWRQVKIVAVTPLCVEDQVYTLSVDDEDHQYVAEGVISKNSSGAHIIHEATFRILQEIPFEKWGKGTGLINQCHDALVFEVPYEHDQYTGEDSQYGWCKKGCTCTASMVANLIKREMNVAVPGLPGVMFAAKPDIAMRWSEV